jgi:hypothetical protein
LVVRGEIEFRGEDDRRLSRVGSAMRHHAMRCRPKSSRWVLYRDAV